MSQKPKIAVLGAGITGISTAHEILEEFGNDVGLTVFAEDFVPNITKSVGAEMCIPFMLGNTDLNLQR